MSDQIRWGILATGNIAHSLAEAIQQTDDGVVTAVGSRTQASADAFADKWSIPNRHASYEALANDPEVDVVYIATPHSHHHDNMQLCLNAGKHVLCEKAFTLTATEAGECIRLARQKNLFLMEAMWMRFFPAAHRLRQLVKDGAIGQVRLLQADFCVQIPYDPQHRLYNMDLGGGALLDLGIYPLSFATMLLGLPNQIAGHAHLSDTGADELDSITLTYNNGTTANLTCSMRIYKPFEAFIVGTEGYIKVHETFFQPEMLTLQRNGKEAEIIHLPRTGNGYTHEVEEVHLCLRSNRIESPIMPLDETMALMRIMDSLRHSWGVRYPNESSF